MDQKSLNWKDLLNPQRFSDFEENKRKNKVENLQWFLSDSRTEIERDYDRILFSTPTRRLADKTQVFPLEKRIGIRNRLTHSHEVSNLARSIGTYLVNHQPFINPVIEQAGESSRRDIPAMLAAIGLAHDLGNPPFGHQGEAAISSWVKKNKKCLFSSESMMKNVHKNDFLKFEGNAQTIRVLTKLQVVDHQYGVNLSFGTLAALMKYSVDSSCADEDSESVIQEKHGFFQSEKMIINEIWNQTGLGEGMRHPLTYIMEACDDVAYSVLDAEDTVKKGLVSFSDLHAWLKNLQKQEYEDDKVIEWICGRSMEDHDHHRTLGLSPEELNDVSMQKFRVNAIHAMVSAVVISFIENYSEIMTGRWPYSLIKKSKVANFTKAIKKFDKEHGYKNRSVLEIELQGYNVIQELMDMLWIGVSERKDKRDLSSERNTPFARYVYNRISENYRKQFEGKKPCKADLSVPIRYRELQLLTDMVSGMADKYALELHSDLKKFYVG